MRPELDRLVVFWGKALMKSSGSTSAAFQTSIPTSSPVPRS